MAFLTINSVDVPVELEPVETEILEIGDQGHADDGTYLSDIDNRVENATLSTRWLSSAEYTSVWGALTTPGAATIAGDYTAETSGYVQIRRRIRQSFASGIRTRIEFILHVGA